MDDVLDNDSVQLHDCNSLPRPSILRSFAHLQAIPQVEPLLLLLKR